VIGISVVFPSGDFLDEGLFVGDAAVETLSGEDAEFGLDGPGTDHEKCPGGDGLAGARGDVRGLGGVWRVNGIGRWRFA
jgi:hypothetical protein